MANQYHKQIIPPFPDNIDRGYFSAWLSGFTDGEGCFHLRQDTRTFKNWPDKQYTTSAACFDITIRADDIGILQLVRSFFQCGTLIIRKRQYKNHGGKPSAVYKVHRTDDLATIIVPHFLKNPMLAKKRKDFLVWKDAVLLLKIVASRPNNFIAPGKGRMLKWTQEEVDRFAYFVTEIKRQREYQVVVNGTL